MTESDLTMTEITNAIYSHQTEIGQTQNNNENICIKLLKVYIKTYCNSLTTYLSLTTND